MRRDPAGPGSRGGNWLLDTVEDVRDYVADHAQCYAGMRISGDRVIVSFAADVEEHLRGLQGSVEHPELVLVETAAYPLAKLEADIQDIYHRLQQDPRRPLIEGRPGHVQLRAAFVELAAQLHEEYGGALDIEVGYKPYPPERIGDREAVPLPTSTVAVPGLDLTIVLDRDRVVGGEDLAGRVVFANRGTRQLTGITGELTGGVRADGDDRLGGNFSGFVTAIGVQVDLEPGSSTDLPIIIGTASCLPDLSYAVPPGRYEIVAAIPFHLPDMPPTPRPVLVARDAWVTVDEHHLAP